MPNSYHELLEFMFELVLKRMNGEEWEWLVVGDWSEAAHKTGDSSSQSTIAVTSEMQMVPRQTSLRIFFSG
jgi:hypothetical protein